MPWCRDGLCLIFGPDRTSLLKFGLTDRTSDVVNDHVSRKQRDLPGAEVTFNTWLTFNCCPAMSSSVELEESFTVGRVSNVRMQSQQFLIMTVHNC